MSNIKIPVQPGSKFEALTVIQELESYSLRCGKIRKFLCACVCGETCTISNVWTKKCCKKCSIQRAHTARAKNPESWASLPHGEAAFNALLKDTRDKAKKRKIGFQLTRDQVYAISRLPCHYCGSAPSMKIGATPRKNGYRSFNGEFIYNGIDRANSSLPYTDDNCVSCCNMCNFMKYTLTPSDFYAKIEAIIQTTRNSPWFHAQEINRDL